MPVEHDVQVGRQIRWRRIAKGMSQETLGIAIGVSLQQIQKYEKGINRIGASRLARIAEVLEIPVASLFAPGDVSEIGSAPAYMKPETLKLLSTRDGKQFSVAISKIKRASVRREIVALVQAIAER